MTTPGPAMRRKQLGDALREVREQAGLTMEQLGARMDLSRSAIGAFESGRNLVSQPTLESFLRVCGALDRFEALNDVRKDAKKPGWWSTYRLPQWLKAYVGLENDADTIRVFSLELMPGLLQDETYARQLHSMGQLSDEEIARRVATRLQRQQLLTGSNPPNFSAVISEGTVRRLLAEPRLAAAQLHQLETMSRLPNVAVHVLPFAAGLHRSMPGSFTLLSFAPGVSLPVAYQEYAIGGHLVDEQDVVRELSDVYEQLRDQALSEAESLAMISELMEQAERTRGA